MGKRLNLGKVKVRGAVRSWALPKPKNPPFPFLIPGSWSHRNPTRIQTAIQQPGAEIKIPAETLGEMWGKKVDGGDGGKTQRLEGGGRREGWR